jgi:pimeloyl-ACP methyl ester carboxylesterase
MGSATEVAVGEVLVDGQPIAYRHAGTGPPLVLLHGGWSDSRDWWFQLEGLAGTYHVLAWDAPGCGGSWDPPDTFGLHGYADALAGFVRALGLERPHLLGLSFGGGLALEVYRRHPALPRSLVLAGAYAGWAGSLPEEIVQERVRRALAEAERPPEEWAAGYLDGFFATEVAPETIDRVVAIISDARPAGIRAMVLGFAEADLRDVLPHIAVPTLVLHGELDARSPLGVGEELHAAIPGSELVVLQGVGHVSNIEAPGAFNAAVRRFLESVRAG